ncbi:hypothetical protein E4U43_000721 [Claviceps pusilla]|uniref:Uncharacterized protein n=1 Tax=Claviceps pusilla TaxID=123648 RepID=A0A9P7N8Y1_9HYPO|nr:hypothetical protein E4U43_000721 [Claviceps pusilla]
MDQKQADGSYPAGVSSGVMPTVDSPSTCPTNNPSALPRYEVTVAAVLGASSSSSSSSSSPPNPIAIPQVAPDPAAPFLSAYPPGLLAHGITPETWHSFLDTISAFLTANASDRAVAHAGDLAKSLGGPPKNYGKSLASHARTLGKQLARDARRRNFVGLAYRAVAGALSIPAHIFVGAVHTVLAIPVAAMVAVSQTPKTPLQRAVTYAAAESKKWLNERGLRAVLLDTTQLADKVGVLAHRFLDDASLDGRDVGGEEKRGGDGKAVDTMRALEKHLQKVMVSEKAKDEVVVLGAQSLWLVVLPGVAADVDEST